MAKSLRNSITDVPGILLGHAQNEIALTGCSVVLCPKNTTAGVDQRGGAPGTRETDALRPMHVVNDVNAIFLSGGSAFGLDVGSGIMKYLNERNIGFNTGTVKVPIVAGAILFDLAIGDSSVRPDADMGYQACLNASSDETSQGNIGAGMGATVGKILGAGNATKSGLGMASMDAGGGIIVAACIAVNAFGDVIDPLTNSIIAGCRSTSIGPLKFGKPGTYANTLEVMKSFTGRQILRLMSSQNTVIGVVATNAKLSKDQANKLAQMAQNGLAKSIRPANLMIDGDIVFALATNRRPADINLVGAIAAEVVAQAVVNAVKAAEPAGGLPCAASFVANASNRNNYGG